MSDIFFRGNEPDLTSYADVNIPFVTCESIEDVIKSLENDSVKLLKWFSDNEMKADRSNWHIVLNSNESSTINMDGNIIKKHNYKGVLGVNVINLQQALW